MNNVDKHFFPHQKQVSAGDEFHMFLHIMFYVTMNLIDDRLLNLDFHPEFHDGKQ